MKKARLFTLLTLVAMLALLLLVGCKKEENISAISLKDHDADSVIETAVGVFDYDDYTLVVIYESGESEEIPLAEEMIVQEDLFKLYQVGEHDVTVCYGAHTYTFKLSVKRSAFENVGFPESNVFTYDGAVHTVEVQGDIPANAVVTYPGGNSFVNAGSYDVTAIVSCEGYVTARLATTVTIERAKYDMSGVRFDAREFVYDGYAHSVAISGTLPDGVSAPTYTINGKKTASATDVGVYEVRASFAIANLNYESIPDMITTLRITAAPYELKGVDLVFKNEDGSVINGLQKVYDAKSVSFEISDKTIVGSKVRVAYVASDEQGNPVTTLKNAGVYTVRMDISLIDGKNYQPIPSITRTFEIKKAQYDTAEIHFDSAVFIYDGNAHKLLVSLPAGHDIKPEDIVYEYRLNGELLQVDPSVGVTNAGVYTVTAIFPVKNANYEQITSIKPATLKIEKRVVDISEIGFYGKGGGEYNGTVYEPQFKTWREINGTDFDYLTYSARTYYKMNALGGYDAIGSAPCTVGFYKCKVTAELADAYKENYILQGNVDELELSVSFEIYPKEIDLSLVGFESDDEFTYDGSPKLPVFDCTAYQGLITTQVHYFQQNASNYFEMSTLPTAAGKYKCVVTVTIADAYAENYTLPDGHPSLDCAFEYQIIPKRIDVTAIIQKGVDEPLTYDWWMYEDKLHNEIKNDAWERVAEMLPDHYNDVNLWYLDSNLSGLTKITQAGAYTVRMNISDPSCVFFDGTTELRSVTIMYIQVTK